MGSNLLLELTCSINGAQTKNSEARWMLLKAMHHAFNESTAVIEGKCRVWIFLYYMLHTVMEPLTFHFLVNLLG